MLSSGATPAVAQPVEGDELIVVPLDEFTAVHAVTHAA